MNKKYIVEFWNSLTNSWDSTITCGRKKTIRKCKKSWLKDKNLIIDREGIIQMNNDGELLYDTFISYKV